MLLLLSLRWGMKPGTQVFYYNKSAIGQLLFVWEMIQKKGLLY
jgi:hypothetical protein